MQFKVINEPPFRGKPYGVTRYCVDENIEFTLTDVIQRKQELIEQHGKALEPILNYIESQLFRSDLTEEDYQNSYGR